MNHSVLHFTRRHFVQSALAAGAALSMAGCSRAPGLPSGNGARQLKVFNWSDYIHGETIPEFERLTGCSVVYDNYSSDSELETRLATGGGSYDVVFPSDRAMIALLANERLRPLDHALLPNLRHIDPQFLGLPFDRANRFSMPYFWGTLAVGIRADRIVEEVHDLAVLFDERFRGRITLLDDMENVVAAVLGYLGRPLNSVEPAHLREAQDLLVKQKPLVQAYTSDSYRERLITGEAWAALGWSGDLLQAAGELESPGNGAARVNVIIPRGGTMLWMDSMAIPRAARNVDLAHAFINHLLAPGVARLNALQVNYATPNLAAQKELPPAMLANESIYPPPAVLARCAWLLDRGRDIERIEQVWRAVRQ